MMRIYVLFLVCLLCMNGADAACAYDDEALLKACSRAAVDDHAFKTFKRDPAIVKWFENVTYEQGREILEYLHLFRPDLVKKLDKYKYSDLVGGAKRLYYSRFKVGFISPTTLQTVKWVADIDHHFGDAIKGMHIVEIGGGYGALCKVLSDMHGFASYTLVDTHECLALAKKYLAKCGIKNVAFIEKGSLENLPDYDLVISINGFSLADRSEQEFLVDTIFSRSKSGFMVGYFVSPSFDAKAMKTDEMIHHLLMTEKKASLKGVRPFTTTEMQTIVWRPHGEVLPSKLKPKAILNKPKNKKQSAITYDFSGGRFGDNLLSYFRAKWLARLHGLPLLYRPFKDAEYLALDTMEKDYSSYRKQYKDILLLRKREDLDKQKESTIFMMPFFPQTQFETYHGQLALFFEVDWRDSQFYEEFVQCLKPNIPIDTVSLPEGFLTVALHVRRGGNYESYERIAKNFPLKMPPDAYYIEQLKRVAELFPDKKIYVYLFTDDEHPENIASYYDECLQNPNITFDWERHADALGEMGMLRDFYSIGKFDCIIRSTSNFSYIASKLGTPILDIQPSHCHFKGDDIVIDEVEILLRE